MKRVPREQGMSYREASEFAKKYRALERQELGRVRELTPPTMTEGLEQNMRELDRLSRGVYSASGLGE